MHFGYANEPTFSQVNYHNITPPRSTLSNQNVPNSYDKFPFTNNSSQGKGTASYMRRENNDFSDRNIPNLERSRKIAKTEAKRRKEQFYENEKGRDGYFYAEETIKDKENLNDRWDLKGANLEMSRKNFKLLKLQKGISADDIYDNQSSRTPVKLERKYTESDIENFICTFTANKLGRTNETNDETDGVPSSLASFKNHKHSVSSVDIAIKKNDPLSNIVRKRKMSVDKTKSINFQQQNKLNEGGLRSRSPSLINIENEKPERKQKQSHITGNSRETLPLQERNQENTKEVQQKKNISKTPIFKENLKDLAVQKLTINLNAKNMKDNVKVKGIQASAGRMSQVDPKRKGSVSSVKSVDKSTSSTSQSLIQNNSSLMEHEQNLQNYIPEKNTKLGTQDQGNPKFTNKANRIAPKNQSVTSEPSLLRRVSKEKIINQEKEQPASYSAIKLEARRKSQQMGPGGIAIPLNREVHDVTSSCLGTSRPYPDSHIPVMLKISKPSIPSRCLDKANIVENLSMIARSNSWTNVSGDIDQNQDLDGTPNNKFKYFAYIQELKRRSSLTAQKPRSVLKERKMSGNIGKEEIEVQEFTPRYGFSEDRDQRKRLGKQETRKLSFLRNQKEDIENINPCCEDHFTKLIDITKKGQLNLINQEDELDRLPHYISKKLRDKLLEDHDLKSGGLVSFLKRLSEPVVWRVEESPNHETTSFQHNFDSFGGVNTQSDELSKNNVPTTKLKNVTEPSSNYIFTSCNDNDYSTGLKSHSEIDLSHIHQSTEGVQELKVQDLNVQKKVKSEDLPMKLEDLSKIKAKNKEYVHKIGQNKNRGTAIKIKENEETRSSSRKRHQNTSRIGYYEVKVVYKKDFKEVILDELFHKEIKIDSLI